MNTLAVVCHSCIVSQCATICEKRLHHQNCRLKSTYTWRFFIANNIEMHRPICSSPKNELYKYPQMVCAPISKCSATWCVWIAEHEQWTFAKQFLAIHLGLT